MTVRDPQSCDRSKEPRMHPNVNRRVAFDCFWPSGCSDSKRCNDHGSCVAASQAGGAQAEEPSSNPVLAAEINALPERVRQYIHDLETNADPAGDKWRILALEWNVAGLTAEIERLRAAIPAVKRAEGWLYALRRLVTLKTYKEINGKDEYYEAEQPEAWEQARRALDGVAVETAAVASDQCAGTWWTPNVALERMLAEVRKRPRLDSHMYSAHVLEGIFAELLDYRSRGHGPLATEETTPQPSTGDQT